MIFCSTYLRRSPLTAFLKGFDLNTAHKQSSKEKKISAGPGFKPATAGWEARMQPLCDAATEMIIINAQ